jgi:septum formation protein
LAFAKANAVAADRDQGLIIGSDQVCVCDGQILGKPGTVEKAVEQLLRAQGKRVIFYTGLCVINAANGHAEQLVEPFTVHFRSLDEAAIRRYVEAERPLIVPAASNAREWASSCSRRWRGAIPTPLSVFP